MPKTTRMARDAVLSATEMNTLGSGKMVMIMILILLTMSMKTTMNTTFKPPLHFHPCLTVPPPGKQDGLGTFKYADGTMHTGQYREGTRNGPGTFRFADGAEHTGAYLNDRMYAL